MKGDESELENHIDLRKYFLLLFRRWRLIRDVIIVVVLGFALFGLTGGRPVPVYEATAGVAISKSKLQVKLEDKIQTISADSTTGTVQDTGTRRNTLASLVKNPLVAREVVKSMGDRLPADLRDPDILVRVVEGAVRKNTDIVDVTVKVSDPAFAADPALVSDIANAWASAFEHYINRVYTDTGISFGSIDQDVATAKAKYEQAKNALLKFNGQDRSLQLEWDINDRKAVLDALQKTRQTAVTSILTKTISAQTDLVDTYQSAALNMSMVPVMKQIDDQIGQLNTLYENKLKLQKTLQDARTLREAASRSPGGADSNSLALLLIKAELATTGNLPSGLQLQVSAPPSGAGGSASQVSDLDALISTLSSRLVEIQAQIDAKSSELLRGGGVDVQDIDAMGGSLSPLSAAAQKVAGSLLKLQDMESVLSSFGADQDSPLAKTMDRLTKEVGQLGTELARESYVSKELTQDYDMAWRAYSTLLGKAQELSIASQLPGSEVVFASPALPPTRLGAASRVTALLNNLGMAIALSFLVGVAGVFAVEYVVPGSPNINIPWTPLGRRCWALVGFLWRRVSRRPAAHNMEASRVADSRADDA